MLVTLGNNTNLAAGGSVTFPYACKSVSKIFIKVDDAEGHGYDHNVTIQLGQRTVCNGVSASGLVAYQGMMGGHESAITEVQYQIDLGNHNLLDNENLYVTVQATNELKTVDVSALVDTPAVEYPVRYTEYSDNVFTAENTLTALCYKDDRSAIDEDSSRVEVRDAVQSSSPSVISANNWYSNESQNNDVASFGILKSCEIPLTATFNYPSSSTINRILVASLMGTNQRAISQGKRTRAIATSQVGK